MKKRLEFVVGSTACGKTAWALERARSTGAEILSCDSLCFYQGMDIGTAKPTPAERARIRHYGIDLVPATTTYSVADYISYRDRVLNELSGADCPVLVVGGSGFYLKSFFAPVTDEWLADAAQVAQVGKWKRAGGGEELLRQLRLRNPLPGDLEGLDTANLVRVEKALLRCLASGLSYRELLARFRDLPPPLQDWDKRVILIERTAEELEIRNRQRVAAMFADGLVAEVERLRAAGFESNPSACRAIGYAEVLDLLDGKCSTAECKEAIIVHTRQLMRRQRNWFRRHLPVDQRLLL